MAQYRMISCTGFWNDPYIEELSAQEKLFYIYLFTCPHTNNAGILHISPRKMAFETGIQDVAQIIDKLTNDGKLVAVDGWYWVKNFIKHQSTTSPKILQNTVSALSEIPQELKNTIAIAYPELHIPIKEATDTLSIPYPYHTDTLTIPSGEIRNMEIGSRNMEEGRGKVEEGSVRGEMSEIEAVVTFEVATLPDQPEFSCVDADVSPNNSEPLQPQAATLSKMETAPPNMEGVSQPLPPTERKKAANFVPPSKEECAEFFRNKGSTNETAGKFWYFYDSKNWMVGKTKMVNWKSAASRWILEDNVSRKPQINGNGNANATKADHAALNSAISATMLQQRMG